VSFPEEPAYSAITYNEDNRKIEYKTDKQDGSDLFPVPYGGRTFFLFNSGKSLVPTTDDYSGKGLRIGAGCVLGTEWKGGTCAPIIVAGKFILTVNKIGPGSVSGGGPYEPNTEVPITATPDDGSSFDGWTVDCSGTDPSVSVLMDRSKICTARFSLDTDVTPPGGGNESCTAYNACRMESYGTRKPDGTCSAPPWSDDLCIIPSCGPASASGAYYGKDRNIPCSEGEPSSIINGVRDWTWYCRVPTTGQEVECRELKRTTGVIEN
jgi:hypothetical protein